MIYLDNAATSMPKPQCVVDAVCSAMQTMGNSGRGVYGTALSASRQIYETRELVAKTFGCPSPNRVIFTSGSTEALNIAIHGLVHPGDHVITTVMEHNSVLRPLYRSGAELTFLKPDGKGGLICLEQAFRSNTVLVVTTHASNLTGDLLELSRIGSLAHQNHAMYLVDASQTAGLIPVDLQRDNIDLLAFSGHKGIMGPQGIGALLMGNGVELTPWKTGGTGVQTYLKEQPPEYPTRLEAGTLNCHGIAGLQAALQFVADQPVHESELALAMLFYNGIKVVPNVRIYGQFDGDRAPIVTLNIGDYSSSEVADALWQDYGISVRAGAHCAPLMHEYLGTVETGAVRFSFGWFNTEEDVTAAIQAVKEIAE